MALDEVGEPVPTVEPGPSGQPDPGERLGSFERLARRRRMTRSFRPDPLPAGTADRLLDVARRAPSAGRAQGTEFLVLEGPEATSRYWDVALPGPRRAGFRWQGLLRAPLLVVCYADPDAYVARYAEPDKEHTGLGQGQDKWGTPFWTVDTAFAAMLLQLAAVDAGLGVLFFGLFDRAPAVAAAFGVPERMQPVGVVAIGRPDPDGDAPGRSAARPRRRASDVVHRGRW